MIIFSTRAENELGRKAIYDWFVKHGLNPEVLNELTIHGGPDKPKAVIYIDDRAFHFEGLFPSTDFIKSFKPWNKK